MKDYANTMGSLCIVHSGASVSLIYARMIGGWRVYAGAVSIEATTVPLALHPSVVHRSLTYAYDTGVVRARAYFVFVKVNK